MAVGRHGHQAVTEVRVRLGAKEDVRVQVDEPGHDVQAGGIDDLPGLRRVDRRRDFGDLAIGDRHVHHPVAAVLRVDDMAALDDDGVGLGRGGRRA